jgi:pimeloyl-ACP methyl ester carboxylesterase
MHRRMTVAPETGYAPVNGLQMYYELHGAGGTPLLLLHGGLFDIEQQFGALIRACQRVAGSSPRTSKVTVEPTTSTAH